MTLFLAKLIWSLGVVVATAIRYPYGRRSRHVAKLRRVDSGYEYGLLAAYAVGLGMLPAVYVTTNQPAFAGYQFQPALAWLGCGVFALALYLFHRSHRDLGRNWAATLVVREQHALVTTGIYRWLRHPMYSSFLLAAVAQALLLPNWIAGPAGLVGFGIFYFGRVRREENMMIETFGDDYRRYMANTSRIIPGIE